MPSECFHLHSPFRKVLNLACVFKGHFLARVGSVLGPFFFWVVGLFLLVFWELFLG